MLLIVGLSLHQPFLPARSDDSSAGRLSVSISSALVSGYEEPWTPVGVVLGRCILSQVLALHFLVSRCAVGEMDGLYWEIPGFCAESDPLSHKAKVNVRLSETLDF